MRIHKKCNKRSTNKIHWVFRKSRHVWWDQGCEKKSAFDLDLIKQKDSSETVNKEEKLGSGQMSTNL